MPVESDRPTRAEAHAGVPVPLERCPSCGYWLRGLPPIWTCPECGLDYDAHAKIVRRFAAGKQEPRSQVWVELIRKSGPFVCSGCGRSFDRPHDWEERWVAVQALRRQGCACEKAGTEERE